MLTRHVNFRIKMYEILERITGIADYKSWMQTARGIPDSYRTILVEGKEALND